MQLTRDQLPGIVKDYGDAARGEWARLARLDKWASGDHAKPTFSNTAEERKYAPLWAASTINLVGQTLNAYKQRCSVDGYRANPRDEQPTSTPWTIWTRSGMGSRQKRLFSNALTHGYSYLFVGRSDSDPGVVLKPISGRTVYCHYEDPDDDFPQFAMQTGKGERGEPIWIIWDDYTIWKIPVDQSGLAIPVRATADYHDTGVVPFSKVDFDWANTRGRGLVEPLIGINDQVNRLTFVLNLIGENSSFALRYMTGVEPATDDDGNPVEPQTGPNKLMLIPDAAGKMGQLDPSDPTGLSHYRDKLVENFYSLAQMPPHYMVGQMANLSAEALVAAESTFAYALDDVTRSFNIGLDRAMRLAAAVAGDVTAARNPDAQILWAPFQVKSRAAEVDALGKAVTMLGIPKRAAWEMFPGVTTQDLERWEELRQQELAESPITQLNNFMNLNEDDDGTDSN